MNRYALLIFITCATHTIFGVPLRDGSDVSNESVVVVWNNLQQYTTNTARDGIGHGLNVLWRTTREPGSNISLVKANDEKLIFPYCRDAGLCDREGNIDEGTRHIIQSSYTGCSEPKFYDMVYPVDTYEYRAKRLWHYLIGFSYLKQAYKEAKKK